MNKKLNAVIELLRQDNLRYLELAVPCKIRDIFLCLVINLLFLKVDWLKMLDIEVVLLCDL